MRVDLRDLLGRAYERGRFDCTTVALEVLRRAGHALPAQTDDDSLMAWLTGAGSPWVFLGPSLDAAQQVGDIALTDSPCGPAHVWALFDDRPPRMFATAMEGHGFVALRARAVRNLRGVYRLTA